MENPQQYIEVRKDWFWLFNDSYKEDIPKEFEEDIPHDIILDEPIFEC